MGTPHLDRLRRWRWAGGIAVGAVLAIVLAYESAYHWRRTRWFCLECGTERIEEIHRLFSWDGPHAPLTTDVDELKPSDALREYFESGHVHHWGSFPGPPTRAGLLGATQCGTGLPGPVLRQHLNDPAFRDFLRRQVSEGKLSRPDVCNLMSMPSSFGSGRRGVPPLSGERVEELAQRAGPILAAYEDPLGEWQLPSWLRDPAPSPR